jgi:hypothetical protein
MKKLLLLFVCSSQLVYSQKALQTIQKSQGEIKQSNLSYKNGGDIIWENNFAVPADWTIGTNGQGTFIIGGNNHPDMADVATYMGPMSTTGTTASNGFAFFNGVQYLIAEEVFPQDSWVESDTIDLSTYTLGFITLSFNQRFRHFNYDSTLVELSEDGGSSWTSFAVNEGIATNDPAVQNTILKLIPVNGSALTRIRFRWKSESSDAQYGSGYGWIVDDVKLIEPYLEDFNVRKTFTNDVVNAYDYYSTPITQVSPMIYGSIVENLGASTANRYVVFDVTRSGSSVYKDSVQVGLAPGQLDTVWISNGYTPDSVGTYTLSVSVADTGVQTNNSLTDEFKVTDYIYGHNYPTTGNSTFGFNAVNAEVGMGNIYQCFNNQQLNGIQVQYGTGTKAGTEVQVEFKEILTGIQDVDNPFLGEAFYTIPSPVNTSSPTDIVFDQPVQLEAGKSYMVVLKFTQSATQDIKFKSTSKGNDDFSTVGFGPFGQGNAVNYYVGWSSSPYISLNFNPLLNLSENSQEINDAIIYPNPSSSETNINFYLQTKSDVNILVTDLSGKAVSSLELTNVLTGSNSAKIDCSSLNSGVYYVTINTANSSITKKFVKK